MTLTEWTCEVTQ